jgi:hypothetical protein
LSIALGAHPGAEDASRLFEDAVRICGVAVAERDDKAEACASCGFNPDSTVKESACPFSALYWDFLLRHEAQMAVDPRLAAQMRALADLAPGDRARLRQRAMAIRLNGGRLPAATDIRPIA